MSRRPSQPARPGSASASSRALRTATRWPRRDVFFLTFVSVAIVFAITGCTFVMNVKNGGGRHLMELMDGAYIGGVIAMTAAGLVLLGALFLKTRDAIAAQLMLSALLVLLHLWAIVAVSRRIASGHEPIDGNVLTGRDAYIAAAALQAIAAIVGVLGILRLRRRSTRTPAEATA